MLDQIPGGLFSPTINLFPSNYMLNLFQIPEHVRTELAFFAFIIGAMFCVSGVKLVNGVRTKFFDRPSSRQFKSAKRLSLKDYLLLEMMQSKQSSFCVTDPDLVDNPIVYCSDAFSQMTGYSYNECEGRNCRFLQGPATRLEDVSAIREAVEKEVAEHVQLTNYRKDGTTFENSFFLCPLFDDEHKLAYLIGIQAQPGDKKENAFYHGLLLSDGDK